MRRRRGAKSVEPESARAVALCLADHRRSPRARVSTSGTLERGVDHGCCAWYRFSLRIDHATDDEHAARSWTLGRDVLVRFDRSLRTGGHPPALCVHCRTEGHVPSATALAATRKRTIAVSLSLFMSMNLSTSCARVTAKVDSALAAACPAAK